MTTLSKPDGTLIADVPPVDFSDVASVESWYGPFGFFENFRKIVLANCRELERAKALVRNEKPLSNERADDLARQSDTYVSFIVEHLKGRQLREKNALQSR